MKQPVPDFVIRGAPRDMVEDPDTGWRRRVLFFGPSLLVDELCVHAGLLSGHVTPHPPHCHDHEELHIALSDNLEFIGCSPASDVVPAEPVDKGSLLFADSGIPHSFRNTASEPAAYLHVRWMKTAPSSRPEMRGLRVYYSPAVHSDTIPRSYQDGCETLEIYSGPSRYLSRLRALFIRLRPGGVVPVHRHAHEVIFVFMAGSAEILGKKVDAPGFAFIGSGVPHYISNHGPEPAELYAFELHQES